LSNKTRSNDRREARSKHDRKYKRKNYTSEIYGARLLFEDARILDDYGKVKEYVLHYILSFSDRREYRRVPGRDCPPHSQFSSR